MLKIETFTQGFKKMQLSFEFEPNLEYQGMIFDSLKEKINDKMFIDSCNAILKDTSKETIKR